MAGLIDIVDIGSLISREDPALVALKLNVGPGEEH
jgi:hypothetical protein